MARAPVAQLVHHLLLHVRPLGLVHLVLLLHQVVTILLLVLSLDELAPLLDVELTEDRIVLGGVGRGRRHPDEDELLGAHRHRRLARDEPAPVPLHEQGRVLRAGRVRAALQQPPLALLVSANLLHELGALPALPSALVQLHHADRRLQRHRVPPRPARRRLGRQVGLLDEHVEVLFTFLEERGLVLEEELRDGHLEDVGCQLQIHQHIVQVDKVVALLQRDQPLLDLEQTAHRRLERLLEVHALLRVDGLVVGLLEFPEYLQVSDVQRRLQLELLARVGRRRQLVFGGVRDVGVPELELVEELDHGLLPLQIERHGRHGGRCGGRRGARNEGRASALLERCGRYARPRSPQPAERATTEILYGWNGSAFTRNAANTPPLCAQ